MPQRLDVSFAALEAGLQPVAVLIAGDELQLGARARRLDEEARGAIRRAAAAADFKGKAKSVIEILGVEIAGASRLLLAGAGKMADASELDWIEIGGSLLGQVAGRRAAAASLVVDTGTQGERSADEIAADLAYGALLRSYKFDKYMKPKTEGENGDKPANGLERLIVHAPDPARAAHAFERRKAVAEGVFLARDLVNEPANTLGPVEFAEATRALEELGVSVEILGPAELRDLKMHALLGVAQGSVREPRVVALHWTGAKSKRTKPLCFVGKGVVFDTGGISMKPAAGMEDMKGDMGGAACVTGLMHALAARKAAVNAVGLIGLVENMPSGNAQRPGDIVKSMSGQTIEVINTDAEGRLVLCDILWWAQERFKPRLIVDLATLTGAIMVALGKEYAGLFANDDKLALELAKAGEATGEKVWRMPLGKGYDKLLESRFADMKNIGGRFGGACTAAQFLARFIKDTPWAHLDVAGTAMDSPKTAINQSWGSGWGVRLLDRLVADGYER